MLALLPGPSAVSWQEMLQDGMLGQHPQSLDPGLEVAGLQGVTLKHNQRILQAVRRQRLPASDLNAHPCSEGWLQTQKAVPTLSLCLLQAANSVEKQGGKMSRSCCFFAVSVSIPLIFIVPCGRGGITHNFQWVFSESHLLTTIVQEHHCSATERSAEEELKSLPRPQGRHGMCGAGDGEHPGRGWHHI